MIEANHQLYDRGKGSVNHNSRKFHAKNTDPERSCLNVEYCNVNVKDVYHELFDEALARYNEKQPEVTAGLTIIMRKSVPASRKNHSMRLSCKSEIRTTWGKDRERTACGKGAR